MCTGIQACCILTVDLKDFPYPSWSDGKVSVEADPQKNANKNEKISQEDETRTPTSQVAG